MNLMNLFKYVRIKVFLCIPKLKFKVKHQLIYMNIRVYPIKNSFGWIIGKSRWKIYKIQKNTNTIIKVVDNYFSITGNHYDVHKARIIIQQLEKEYHKLMTSR